MFGDIFLSEQMRFSFSHKAPTIFVFFTYGGRMHMGERFNFQKCLDKPINIFISGSYLILFFLSP